MYGKSLDVTTALHELGINSDKTGHAYLQTAIEITIEALKTAPIGQMALYRRVAEFHDTTPTSVERNIRYAIKTFIPNCTIVSWNKYLRIGYKPEMRIANGVFIHAVAISLILQRAGQEEGVTHA